MNHIGIIGAGAWGTALAVTLARAGRAVTLWGWDLQAVAQMAGSRENTLHLPGIALVPEITLTADLAHLASVDAMILAVPAQHVADYCSYFRPHLPVMIAAKGIEIGTGRLMSEVVAQAAPEAIPVILSGPTFAREVALGLPAVITLACADAVLGRQLVEAVGTSTFRPYLTDDLAGAQVGGAVKNVLAIACGIVEGRGLGDNARAALVTRGLAELTRYAVARGGRPSTLMGPSGVGDLVLTAASKQSRNYSLGLDLGKGYGLDAALERARGVTEGVWTAGVVAEDAQKLGIDMPVVIAVDQVINGRVGLDDAIAQLLSRPFRLDGY